jgi:hypothetical protein
LSRLLPHGSEEAVLAEFERTPTAAFDDEERPRESAVRFKAEAAIECAPTSAGD